MKFPPQLTNWSRGRAILQLFQLHLSALALLINLTHKSFWYSNPSLDVVLAQLLCGGAAEEGGDVYRGVDVEGGVPPAPGEVESLARPHRALQQGHLGSRAVNGPSRSFTMPGDYPYLTRGLLWAL